VTDGALTGGLKAVPGEALWVSAAGLGSSRLTDIFLPKEETAAMISGYDASDRRELGDRATNVMIGRDALHLHAGQVHKGGRKFFI
jgi:hypothetical protein